MSPTKEVVKFIKSNNCFNIRPQFVDTLFIVRLMPNMSMRRAVINYFLVQKIEVGNLILLSTHVLL